MRRGIYRWLVCPIALCWLVLISGCGAVDLLGTGSPDNPGEASGTESGVDKACLDIWSLVHFAAGYGFGEVLDVDQFVPAYAALYLYELWEIEYWPNFSENELNQCCDMYFGSAGWLAWWLTQQ